LAGGTGARRVARVEVRLLDLRLVELCLAPDPQPIASNAIVMTAMNGAR
jgi:hypothetical protein